MADRRRHALVLAPDDFTRRRLEELPGRERYAFHDVLARSDLLSNRPRDFDALLDEVREAIRSLPQVDGILAFWDFPATCLAAVLERELGLPGPTLESVLACEHKHWARCIQREAAPEVVPLFEQVDPFDDRALDKLMLDFPFWLKPIKSASSALGFRIGGPEDFRRAITRTRERIHIYGDSFGRALRYADLPASIRRKGSNYCIAEGLIDGDQVTLEGYVRNHQVHFHGAVDSVRHSNRSTFSRYEYPSRLAPAVIDRMQRATCAVLEQIGYDNATFNAEFFHDEPNDRIWLVEINPRISQSHAKLFQLVDGVSNFSELVSVALGEDPPERSGGQYACAAKLFYRTVLEDATITAVPSAEEIRAIEKNVPGVEIQVDVKVGTRLSELPCQDSYSFELAMLHIGGKDEGEILQKYQECLDHLTFGFRNMEDVDFADGHHRVSAIPQLLKHKLGAARSRASGA